MPPSLSPHRAGRAAAPPTARAAAPIDLTGTWVSVVTEDWRWRMRTPPKGDYASVPLNAAANESRRRVGSREGHRGRRAVPRLRRGRDHAHARPHPHLVGQRHHAEDRDRGRHADAAAELRRASAARRAVAGRARRSPTGSSPAADAAAAGTPRGGSLRVITTNLRPGYLRKNGVPYSANARLTEYINRTNEANGDAWLVVTTVVEDPQNLTSRFVTSSHFKKVPDGSAWSPTPCSAS